LDRRRFGSALATMLAVAVLFAAVVIAARRRRGQS